MSETKEVIELLLANKSVGSPTWGNNHDMLSIAKKIMVELVKSGYAEFLLLRDDEVSKWWNYVVTSATKKITKHNEDVRMYEVKLTGYNKLSSAERTLLKIRKPIPPKPLI